MNYEDSFESFDSECNQTHPETVGSLKKGSYIILKGFPCKVLILTSPYFKITDISSSKTGKHGHAKTVMTGIDIFTGKKYEGSFPTSHQIDVPDLKKVEYAIAGIDLDNWISLVAIGKESSTKEMKLPCDEDSKDVE